MTHEQMAELAARLREAPPETPIYHFADGIAALIESMAQRVPLSDEQIWALWDYSPDMSWKTSVINLGHAIEQAHGIRSEK